jgi:phage repressor protein C with HTH and peptisase S24 domain
MITPKSFPDSQLGLVSVCGYGRLTGMFGVGDVVRKLRKERGLTLDGLAELAGVGKMTLMHLENENRDPRGSTINKVAKALGLRDAGGLFALVPQLESDLPDHTGTGVPVVEAERDHTDVGKGYELDSIPVLLEGEATPGGMQWTNTVSKHAVIEYMDRPPDLDDPDAYGLMVVGDSMQPILYRGYRVIASPNTPIEDGNTVYVQMLTGERLIKIAYRDGDGWRLESLNRKYDPKPVKDDQIEAIHRIVSVNLTKPGRRVIDEQTGKRIRG